jgi:hypothetical protein
MLELSDLKRLVESVDLVKEHRGLDKQLIMQILII